MRVYYSSSADILKLGTTPLDKAVLDKPKSETAKAIRSQLWQSNRDLEG